MTPQEQEFVHKPEIGQYGDCQRAVIASLLDLPISSVPHFLQIANGDTIIYYEELQKFLLSKGYAYLTVRAFNWDAFFGLNEEIYHEISGPSPRGNGVHHAVVGKGGKIVFDPHPSKAGLAGSVEDWYYSFLVKAQY